MIDDVLVRGGGAAALVRAMASKKSSDITIAANGKSASYTDAVHVVMAPRGKASANYATGVIAGPRA